MGARMDYGKIWIDGHVHEYADAVVGPMSHSLSYASSVYEGIRAYRAKPLLLDLHLARLRKSCEIFGHRFPYTDTEIGVACAQLMQMHSVADAYIKIQVILDDSGYGFQGKECKSK